MLLQNSKGGNDIFYFIQTRFIREEITVFKWKKNSLFNDGNI